MRKNRLSNLISYAAAALITAVLVMPSCVSYAAEGYEGVGKVTGSLRAAKYGMVPIYARDVKEGAYPVRVDSSSSFFKIAEAELTVKGDRMTARILIGSFSYKCVYAGTAAEAAKAPLEDYIMAEETDLGTEFEIPVEALNKEIPLAAFSKRKKKWYDRMIVVNASSLPEGAVGFEVPDYDMIDEAVEKYGGADSAEEEPEETAPSSSEPADIDMKDGTYSIEVMLTGGSGRASVSSPTWLIVKDGKAYARLLWSSSYYDYMIVGGEKYLNESEEGGNSTFTIPVTAFDKQIPVVGDTTAMGEPVAIDYRLIFYRDSVSGKGKIPQEAAQGVIIFAAAIAVIGGILNYILKKRADRKR